MAVSGTPRVGTVEKLTGTISDGNTSVTLTTSESFEKSQTWILLSFRASGNADAADDTLCGYEIIDSTNIKVLRSGSTGDVEVLLQVVEFTSGVHVEHGKQTMPKNDLQTDVTLSTAVDTSQAFPMVWTNYPNAGWDGIQEYLTTATLEDSTTLRLESNGNATGFTPISYTAYWQVIEINGATVQSGTRTSGRQLETDQPVDLGSSFIIYHTRTSSGTGGSARLDAITSNMFMIGGTAAAMNRGITASSIAEWHLVTVPEWQIELAPLQFTGSGTDAAITKDVDLKSITDADKTVALMPWRNLNGFVDGASSDKGSEVSATARVVDNSTLRYQRENGFSDTSVDMYAIQFTTKQDIVNEALVLKNLQKVETTMPQGSTQKDVSITAVDTSKTVVWATNRGPQDAFGTHTNVVRLLDTDTVRIERNNARDNATDTLIIYVAEFESGVNVTRATINGADSIDGQRKTIRTDAAIYNRSFIIAQSYRVSDGNWSPSISYTGNTTIRCMGPLTGTGIQSGEDHTHYQLIEIRDNTAVEQVTLQMPGGTTSKSEALQNSFTEDARFLAYTRQIQGSGNEAGDRALFETDFQSATSFRARRFTGTNTYWLQGFALDTQNVTVEQARVEMASGTTLAEVGLENSFSTSNSGVFFPYQGFIGRQADQDADYNNAFFTAELTSETTVELIRDKSTDTGSGTFYVLGFSTTAPKDDPWCPVDDQKVTPWNDNSGCSSAGWGAVDDCSDAGWQPGEDGTIEDAEPCP